MTVTDKPAWIHWAVALALLVLGGNPFVTGEYQTRSVMWNGAAFVLLLFGALRVWTLWKGVPAEQIPGWPQGRP
jgi:hypothetical protein